MANTEWLHLVEVITIIKWIEAMKEKTVVEDKEKQELLFKGHRMSVWKKVLATTGDCDIAM